MQKSSESEIGKIARETKPLLSRGPKEHRTTITPREREVLLRTLDGRSPGEVALDIGTSKEMVKKHIKHISDKKGLGSKIGLIRLAHENPGALGLSNEEPSQQNTDARTVIASRKTDGDSKENRIIFTEEEKAVLYEYVGEREVMERNRHTRKTHLSNALSKLMHFGQKNRSEMAIWWFKNPDSRKIIEEGFVRPNDTIVQFTEAEIGVMQSLIDLKIPKQIGNASTVKVHIRSVYNKLKHLGINKNYKLAIWLLKHPDVLKTGKYVPSEEEQVE